MEITPTLPLDSIASLPQSSDIDSGREALEQRAIEGYRNGTLSRFQVQCMLGFDNRYETEEWLDRQGAHPSYSVGDLQADRVTLDRLLPR